MEGERVQRKETAGEHEAAPTRSAGSAPAVSLGPLYYGGGPGVCIATGRRVQEHLDISQPGDAFEQEADSVAERVMRMPETTVRLQRKCACGGSGAECGECGGEGTRLQRRAAGRADAGAPAPAIVRDVLGSPGCPLDAGARAFMEPRFGVNLGDVRVHTDARAAESARAVNALAYTVGRDVVFGLGQYAPGTDAGQRLIAHELTHTIQQRTTGGEAVQRQPVSPTTPTPTPTPTPPATTGTAAATGTCTQQDIDDIRAEALTWLADIYDQLLTYYVDEVFAEPGVAPTADHQRVAGALQQAFNTTDLGYVEVIRRRFLHIANMLREVGRVAITCGGTFCRSGGSGFTAAYVEQPYALVLCHAGTAGSRPITTFIHELGHAVLPQVGIRNTLTGQGSGIRDRSYTHERVFHHLSPEETLDNAESYGLLADLLHSRVNRQVVAQQTDTAPGCSNPTTVLAAFARADQWNRYAEGQLSAYVQFIGANAYSTLPQGDRDRITRSFPAINTTPQLQSLLDAYVSLNSNGFSAPNWDFGCVTTSPHCTGGVLGFAAEGRVTNAAVTLRTIRTPNTLMLCPDWFTASSADQIRTIYALFILGRPSWIVAGIPLADAFTYVDFARLVVADRAPAPTTSSAHEHITRDAPTAPLPGAATGTTAPSPPRRGPNP